MVEPKTFRGELWAAFGMERHVRNMWERFTLKKTWARSGLADADKERQNGTDGGWQQETTCKKRPEFVRHSSDLRFEGILMRRADHAVKSGKWQNCVEEFLKGDRLSVWASVKVRDCYNEVESEDEDGVSIAHDIQRKSTDFLRIVHQVTE